MLSIYGYGFEQSFAKQKRARITTTPTTTKICPEFIRLLKVVEPEQCDSCKHKNKDCINYDCVSQIAVCENFSCRKNIFYHETKFERHPTVLSQILRNCEFGIALLMPDIELTLHDIASMFGLTREGVRTIEARALSKVVQRAIDLYRMSDEATLYYADIFNSNLQKLTEIRNEYIRKAK